MKNKPIAACAICKKEYGSGKVCISKAKKCCSAQKKASSALESKRSKCSHHWVEGYYSYMPLGPDYGVGGAMRIGFTPYECLNCGATKSTSRTITSHVDMLGFRTRWW